jgi:hypothetical protein
MNNRERFRAVFQNERPDRPPVLYFGTWEQTKQRWKEEGLDTDELRGDAGPQLSETDPDWERGMWNCQGLVKNSPMTTAKERFWKKRRGISFCRLNSEAFIGI